jgi:hypothetical protein
MRGIRLSRYVKPTDTGPHGRDPKIQDSLAEMTIRGFLGCKECLRINRPFALGQDEFNCLV